MQPFIAARRAELAEICQRHHVHRLDVFGSAARGDFDENRSDVDFVVEFESDGSANPLDTYFGLKEALEALLGRRVDLVMSGAVENPYIKASIERSREPVYAA
jgi:uncharacterized protein